MTRSTAKSNFRIRLTEAASLRPPTAVAGVSDPGISEANIGIRYMESSAAQQGDGTSRLLRFLLDADSYPHKPKHVRVEQTHASCVFIAPPFVFKVKKPVDFGFLDFSTLEKRRFYCQREVDLNRRLCPSIYLGVIPIWSKAGRFSFKEGGRIVEYAVKMRHLSERYFLNRRIARHNLTSADLDRVAAALEKFYVSQTPTAEIEAWGRIEKLRISTDENFRQMRGYVGHTLSHAAWEAIWTYTERFYSRNASLFQSRIREGWIRDCHGDLHLDHIHLAPRSLHIYDCIEFNDRIRFVDVASDIAFLAMDFDYAGRPDLAPMPFGN